jgi:hypothetical protein
MTIRRLFVISFAALSLAAVPSFAQMSSSSSSTNTQNAATAQAGKAVAKAQADVNKIQSDMVKIHARIRAQMLAKPEWSAVVNARKQAEQNLDQVKKTVLATIRNKDDYKNLAKEREQARQTMSEAGADPSSPEVQKAADTYVKDGFAIKQMEMAALKDDPRYDDAYKQLEAADAKMKELDAQVDQAQKDDPEYQTAEKQLETAKTALAGARTQLAQAAKQDRDARAAQAKARQNQQGGGGTSVFR